MSWKFLWAERYYMLCCLVYKAWPKNPTKSAFFKDLFLIPCFLFLVGAVIQLQSTGISTSLPRSDEEHRHKR